MTTQPDPAASLAAKLADLELNDDERQLLDDVMSGRPGSVAGFAERPNIDRRKMYFRLLKLTGDDPFPLTGDDPFPLTGDDPFPVK